jgi:ABC-type Na+ efflux pump permease subunit
MSTVIVVVPLIIANWPVITAAVTAAIGTMGFSIVRGAAQAERASVSGVTRTEIEVEDAEILPDAGSSAEELVVERDGVRAVFSRDARGALKVCMEGAGVSKAELKRIGEELIGRVTQQYVYHRVITELKQRNMAVVDEEVAADRTVKIRVRNW